MKILCLSLSISFFVSNLALAKKQLTMVSLGDSISTATNSDGFGNNLENSWSTGSSVSSHYNKLQNDLGFDVTAYNFSKSGAIATDIEGQVTRAIEVSPDYTTLLIGANDVCHWESDHIQSLEAFEQKLDSQVQRLLESNENMKILMGPIPDMLQLYEMGKNKGCQWKWNIFGICSNLLSSSRTQTERIDFKEKLDQANLAIQSVAQKYDNTFFDGSLSEFQFEWQHISGIDCFHPSRSGQEMLAEMTWVEEIFEDF